MEPRQQALVASAFQVLLCALHGVQATRFLQQAASTVIPAYPLTASTVCKTAAGTAPQVGGFTGSPFALRVFQEEFKNTETKKPDTSKCDGHRCVDAYNIKVIDDKFDLQTGCNGATNLMAYDGMIPGPTIEGVVGREILIRFTNEIKTRPTDKNAFFEAHAPCDRDGRSGRPISVHLHGSASLAPYDGWAEDVTCYKESKEYFYPMNRPATGWYHDHALDITSDNANFGLAAMLPIRNATERWNLQGMEEYRLMLNDKALKQDCQIRWDLQGEHKDNYYGDINFVSGIPFPYSNVDPKWVRFRVVNAAVSRPYLLKFVKYDPITKKVTEVANSLSMCKVIASDGGFRSSPVAFPATGVFMGVAERYEFVCDFSKVKGQTVYLWNEYDSNRMKDVPFFCNSHLVMKFNVGTQCKSGSADCAGQPVFDGSKVWPTHLDKILTPSELKTAVDLAKADKCTRYLEFGKSGGHWAINGETWRTMRNAAQNVGTNSWEVWCLKTGGGWFHPVHIHLADFYVVQRYDSGSYRRQDDYEKMVPKDVVQLHPGSQLAAVVVFGPHRGEYMFHCHNLRHEDVEMMRSFSSNMTMGKRSATGSLGAITQLQYTRSKDTGVLYDDYKSPLTGNTNARPSDQWDNMDPDYLQTAYIDKELHRIFYPRNQDRDQLCTGNPWAVQPNSCPN